MSETAWIVVGVVVLVAIVGVVMGPRLTKLKVKTKAGSLEAEGAAPPPPAHSGVTMEGVKGKQGVTGFSDTSGGVTMRNIESEGQVRGDHRRAGGATDPKP
jgi:hypothetical protein